MVSNLLHTIIFIQSHILKLQMESTTFNFHYMCLAGPHWWVRLQEASRGPDQEAIRWALEEAHHGIHGRRDWKGKLRRPVASFLLGGGGSPISLVHHLRAHRAREQSDRARGGCSPPLTRGSFCNFYTKMERSGAYLMWNSCRQFFFFLFFFAGGGGGGLSYGYVSHVTTVAPR